MRSSQPGKPPLTRLVLFMLCISVAGAVAAGIYWYAVDLPEQNAGQAPSNAVDKEKCQAAHDTCLDYCGPSDLGCPLRCDRERTDCFNGRVSDPSDPGERFVLRP